MATEQPKIEPVVIVLSVKSWRNTDKYSCPMCEKKLGMPDYTCKDCNVKVKPVIKF
jgi:hypothetical protein